MMVERMVIGTVCVFVVALVALLGFAGVEDMRAHRACRDTGGLYVDGACFRGCEVRP
jgi:hypothetical protein